MSRAIDSSGHSLAFLKWCNVVLVALMIVILVAGLSVLYSDRDVVRARAIQLVGSNGEVRAELVVRNGSPGLYLKDVSGLDRVALFDEPDGSGLHVMDSDGVTRIGVVQFAHGGGGVALHGPESKGAAVLYLKQSGSLRFFDRDGKVTNEVSAAGR